MGSCITFYIHVTCIVGERNLKYKNHHVLNLEIRNLMRLNLKCCFISNPEDYSRLKIRLLTLSNALDELMTGVEHWFLDLWLQMNVYDCLWKLCCLVKTNFTQQVISSSFSLPTKCERFLRTSEEARREWQKLILQGAITLPENSNW